jgi:uncharacterized membrane protein HdeD (DUF308 family)
VSSLDDNVTHAARYWPWVLLRALVAVVLGVAITFTADHSALLGYLAFGAFALVSGAVLIAGSLIALSSGVLRWFQLAQGAVSAVLGALALLTTGAGLPFLILLLSAWAVITGFLELYVGLRSRGRLDYARDWLFAGGLTVLFAIVVLVVPGDYNQPFTGPDGIERALTASVILVGVLGAYGAVLGVYLVIAGLSLKWANRAAAATAAESGS